jgi:hypothetical protein
MIAKDDAGWPLVNTPADALQQLAADYEAHCIVATLSFSTHKKRAVLSGHEHTLIECTRAVAGTRAAGLDDLASEWRRIEEFVRALQGEMHMWILVSEHKFRAAWDMLVTTQGSAYWAACWLPNFEPAQQLEEHLSIVERVLFPKQRFFSPAMIINEAEVECSICHVRGGECNHVAGDIYAGEVAHRIIHDIEGVREISLVENPADKRARAMYYDGMDLLTGELTGDSTRAENKSKKRRARRIR